MNHYLTFRPMNLKLCIFLALAPFAPFAHAAEFHVSPTGTNANPGTAAKPFASLEKARDAARSNKGSTVILAPGFHRRTKTFELDARDSGTVFTGKGASIVGSVAIPNTSFKPVTDADNTVKVKAFDLSNKSITTVHPHMYGFSSGNVRNLWTALNLLEEISVLGEFMTDRKTGKLYFLPPAGFDATKSMLEVTVMREPLVAIADVGYDSPVWRERYPGFADYFKELATMPRNDLFEHNIFVGTPTTSTRKNFGIESKGIVFRNNLETEDRSFFTEATPSQPVFKANTGANLAGFTPIPFGKISRLDGKPVGKPE